MHHPIFKLTPVMLAFYSKSLYSRKREAGIQGVFSSYMNGKLRYTQEAYRHLNITQGAVRKQQKIW